MGDILPLFPDAKTAAPKFEVHEHCFISGPRANRWDYKFEHSHPNGDVPHTHEHTGPSSYTIDKDEWLRMTGLSGGGRKKFTAKPLGLQLVAIPRAAEDSAFEIIVCDPPAPPDFEGEGGGHHAAARMVLAFGLTPIVRRASPEEAA